MTIRYMTAGESHGKCLTAILEGIPSGVPITVEEVNVELARRQYTFGRGERQQFIEKDSVQFVSGVRFGQTIGDPITLVVKNRDWENWGKIMSTLEEDFDDKFLQLKPRPGHADLAGVIKFDRRDIRDILERASARETAVRTAVGTVCRKFLSLFGIDIFSWVLEIGGVKAKLAKIPIPELAAKAKESPVLCPDPEATKAMMNRIKAAKAAGDTLGGIYQVVAMGLPVGMGSFQQWDLKLDGLLAQALMSIQAHKGVEVGGGFSLARMKGSRANDELFFEREGRFFRKTNHAGGIEGGMTNGEPLVVRAVVKPIASLKKPLRSVNIRTKEEVLAEIVRSDIAPIPAASVVGEAVVAITLGQEFKRKFGGDSLREIKDNFDRYQRYVQSF